MRPVFNKFLIVLFFILLGIVMILLAVDSARFFARLFV